MIQRSLTFILLTVSSLWANAQRIDNTAAFRNMPGDKSYFRFHYDNDFESRAVTDYYYTQGYSFELGLPVLQKSILAKALLRFKDQPTRYGLAFEHLGFTPTSIQSNEILRGDRPFAGVIMLKSFAMSVDTARRQRMSSVLVTGMIGPAAFAGRMQATIHRLTNNIKPSGWQYQIGNDIAINYELNHEKQLLFVPNVLSLNTNAQLRLGTLSDRAQAGLTLTLGRFNSPLTGSIKRTKPDFQVYVYTQPLLSVVGYDATLQGGIFNRNNPYTLAASEINRGVFQNNYGVVVTFWKFYAEYYRTYLSKEFKIGREHAWGGLKLGVAF